MHPDWIVTAAAAFDTEWPLAIFVALTLADALRRSNTQRQIAEDRHLAALVAAYDHDLTVLQAPQTERIMGGHHELNAEKDLPQRANDPP